MDSNLQRKIQRKIEEEVAVHTRSELGQLRLFIERELLKRVRELEATCSETSNSLRRLQEKRNSISYAETTVLEEDKNTLGGIPHGKD